MGHEAPAASKPQVSSSASSDSQNPDEPSSQRLAISAFIRPEIISAQRALRAKQWSFALQILDAADAKSADSQTLTPVDAGSIAYLRGFASAKLQRWGPAQDAYEKALANGVVPTSEVVAVLETLMRLAATNHDHARAVVYSRQLANISKLTPKDYETVAMSFAVLHEITSGMIWCDRAIAASQDTGSKPSENVLRYKLQFAYERGDRALMIAAWFDLIRLYGKTKDWNALLRLERNDAHDDKNLIMIERLMYDTGAMSAESDFVELAQHLGDAGFAQEALMVLKNVKDPSIPADRLERIDRLRARLAQKVDTEPVKVGIDDTRELLLANASERGRDTFGAPTDIERTLTRSQFDQPGELSLYVGRVLARQGDTVGARAALNKFAEVSSPTVSSLWKLYADTLPEPENPT
jgi:hypothetical protein